MSSARFAWKIALGLLILLATRLAFGQVLPLEQVSDGLLGRAFGILIEGEREFDLKQAIVAEREGRFQPGQEPAPKFGIGARPVWLHLAVDNRSGTAVNKRLLIEAAWLDRIDLYHVVGDSLLAQRQAGDADASRQHPLAGVGFVFDLRFPPGRSDLYLRIATPDPLVLPVRLLDPEPAENLLRQYGYGYGLLYGMLLALIAYNAVLGFGLRDRSHLDYALYLGCFVLLNLAYTGHGYAWLWPSQPGLQQYIIVVLMVVFGCLGLRFASGFLRLAEHEPLLHRLARRFSAIGLTLVLLTTLLQRQQQTVMVAFVFVLIYSLAMVWLGVVTVRHGRVAGRYFLAAALAAMFGAAITDLAVWFGVPFSPLAFHAAGWGIVVEGILLALALSHRVRQHQIAQVQAERLARLDSLTGLINRRAFLEHADRIWSTALRNRRPLTVIMIDLDHFKNINDTRGHAMGDQVLAAVGRVLEAACRSGDIAARWGGEEFILLLPETGAGQAAALAERLRGQIGALRFDSGGETLALTASFGVAERDGEDRFDALIRAADQLLYQAKKSGRNRVCGTPLPDAPLA